MAKRKQPEVEAAVSDDWKLGIDAWHKFVGDSAESRLGVETIRTAFKAGFHTGLATARQQKAGKKGVKRGN